ncbi:PH domain containing protein [Acanthamoeba castellanii str. Neff]|uniref:PH domain containing protein n=1 Tax=Acanthamoeba castellanii (strain ATCC 30010 / Neff) TaxID=1257118 RepID=L8GIR8_ACACF|nr:PH domain containing protein [Acanthamoeba castellanii str. Neff]ELR12975.1 PH domain containing protein [Acanthamoeba castellanii str. Neff]
MSVQVPFDACSGGDSPSSNAPSPTTDGAKRVQGLVSLRLQQLSSSDLLSAPTSKERRLSLVELESKKRSRLIRQWEKMSQEIESAQKREELERSRRQAISRQKSQLPPARRRFAMRRRAPSVVSSDGLDTIRPLADYELDHEASTDGGQPDAEANNDDGGASAAAAAFRRLTKSGLISPRTRPQGPAWGAAQTGDLTLGSRRGGLRESPHEVGGGSVADVVEATEGKNWLVSACGRLPRAVLVKIGGRPSDQTKKPSSVEPHTTDAHHDAASHSNDIRSSKNNDNNNNNQQNVPHSPEAQKERQAVSEVETFLRQRRGSTVQASGLAIPKLSITASPDPVPRRGRQRRVEAVEGANNTSSGTDDDAEEADEGNTKSLVDEEYSSEEEKEDGDGVKVVVKCRSKTINRDPVKKQGWLIKLGDGLFAQWKKRFGYTLPPTTVPCNLNGRRGVPGAGKPPEDRISLRGGCMVDAATNGIKNVKRADCTFRVSGGKKMFLLEAASPEEKKEWIEALWTNVFYANPAKRHSGVAYTVELQGLRMIDTTTKFELWQRPAQHIQSITRPEEDKERWVIFDFGDNGGWVVVSLQPTTTPTAIYNSVQSILLTHTAWKGNPILLGNY